jgi:hypothetical protein
MYTVYLHGKSRTVEEQRSSGTESLSPLLNQISVEIGDGESR